jgi:hypothetical protein
VNAFSLSRLREAYIGKLGCGCRSIVAFMNRLSKLLLGTFLLVHHITDLGHTAAAHSVVHDQRT